MPSVERITSSRIPRRKKEILLCYAREDEALCLMLKKHLMVLQRQQLIGTWHDRDISAGAEWEQEIDIHLNNAEIILLLISSDFMASDYCYGIEMKRAMERYRRGDACVIPVILRPTYWQNAPFGKLQALPKDGIPVTSRQWHDQDEAFLDVTQGIMDALKSRPISRLQRNSGSASEKTASNDYVRKYRNLSYGYAIGYEEGLGKRERNKQSQQFNVSTKAFEPLPDQPKPFTFQEIERIRERTLRFKRVNFPFRKYRNLALGVFFILMPIISWYFYSFYPTLIHNLFSSLVTAFSISFLCCILTAVGYNKFFVERELNSYIKFITEDRIQSQRILTNKYNRFKTRITTVQHRIVD